MKRSVPQVNEQECSTELEEKFPISYVDKCSTTEEEKCSVTNKKECTTEYREKYPTSREKECTKTDAVSYTHLTLPTILLV